MVHWKRGWHATFALAFLAGIGGCAGSESLTAPEEEHPAIPMFAEAACAEWSCVWNDCTYDPAVYGACCVTAADAEHPVQDRPSCDAPPPSNTDYCVIGSPRLTCINKPIKVGDPVPDCSKVPLTGDTGSYYPECGESGPQ